MQTRSFRNGRLSEFALHEVQRMITEEYPVPGSRLPKEVELADRFQMGRIVIREAMKILEDRGVVEVRAGRGTLTVAPSPKRVKTSLLQLFRDQPMITIQEMEQLLELRKVLEETSAGLAAVRATADDLNEIEAALEEMRNSGAARQQAVFANFMPDDADASELLFRVSIILANKAAADADFAASLKFVGKAAELRPGTPDIDRRMAEIKSRLTR